jgi:hypothetical protein
MLVPINYDSTIAWMLCIVSEHNIDFLPLQGILSFIRTEETTMRDAGLRIVRIENVGLGANEYPVWNSGPKLPAELLEICKQRQGEVPPTSDKLVVRDEDGNCYLDS